LKGTSNVELSKKFAKRREEILEDEKSIIRKRPRFERRNFDTKKDSFDRKKDNFDTKKNKRSKFDFGNNNFGNNKKDKDKNSKNRPKFR